MQKRILRRAEIRELRDILQTKAEDLVPADAMPALKNMLEYAQYDQHTVTPADINEGEARLLLSTFWQDLHERLTALLAHDDPILLDFDSLNMMVTSGIDKVLGAITHDIEPDDLSRDDAQEERLGLSRMRARLRADFDRAFSTLAGEAQRKL